MRMDRHWTTCGWAIALLLVVSPAYSATVALKAVRRNSVPINPPLASVVASPGDIIEANIFVFDWATELPQGIRAYELIIQGAMAAVSGTNGTVLPLGWDAAIEPVPCNTDPDCAFGEVCRPPTFRCVRPDHNPTLGAFVIATRPDYLLFKFTNSGPDINTATLGYSYFSLAFEKDGASDTGQVTYAGTLILKVSEGACGTFTVPLASCGASLLASPSLDSISPQLNSLIIQLPECPPLPVASSPQNCSIDARIPSVPGITQALFGWDSLELHFNESPMGLTEASFRTRTVPVGETSSVSSVETGTVMDALETQLDQPIATERWTCVEHRPSLREGCLAALPGDVDQNQMVGAHDATALVSNLRRPGGQPSIPMFQCDIDRSGNCGPLDLLTLLDLLNGAGFEAWDGAAILPLCPSRNSLIERLPRGACCSQIGSCAENVLESTCASSFGTWVRDATCCEAPCLDALGTCCDIGSGSCANGVAQSSCLGIAHVWTESSLCSSVVCSAAQGACCNLDTGVCTDGVLRQNCSGPSDSWRPGAACGGADCRPN